MMLAIEADDAWCPPTFTPELLPRTRFAWWIMLTASHRTRRWMWSSTSKSPSMTHVLGAQVGTGAHAATIPVARLTSQRIGSVVASVTQQTEIAQGL